MPKVTLSMIVYGSDGERCFERDIFPSIGPFPGMKIVDRYGLEYTITEVCWYEDPGDLVAFVSPDDAQDIPVYQLLSGYQEHGWKAVEEDDEHT